ncbi:unnamed protein product [Cylicocyclus nassatus]|uniref:Uncharacterized protein n=1 Tax=Cylicocyclus nassatus TaxID=53992 RepID=A0AA36H7U9_CYLNA|nr:unnamed protein product [Cylicocyclus nassatus]
MFVKIKLVQHNRNRSSRKSILVSWIRDCIRASGGCASIASGVLYCFLITFLPAPNFAEMRPGPSPVPRNNCKYGHTGGYFPNDWIDIFKHQLKETCNVQLQYNCYTHDTADYYAYLRVYEKSNVIQYYSYDYILRGAFNYTNGTGVAKEVVEAWKKEKFCNVSLFEIEILIVYSLKMTIN